jgi:hypothetical protein
MSAALGLGGQAIVAELQIDLNRASLFDAKTEKAL